MGITVTRNLLADWQLWTTLEKATHAILMDNDAKPGRVSWVATDAATAAAFGRHYGQERVATIVD
jgi:hypothetical protein